jgi:PAS domain S-box-containing protein
MLAEATEMNDQRLNDLSDYFYGAPVGLQMIDGAGMIRRANLAGLRLLDYDEQEYVGRHVGEFFAEPEVVRAMLDKLAAGESIREFEATLIRRDGKKQEVLIYANSKRSDGILEGIRCAIFPHPDDLRPDIAEAAALTDQSVEAHGRELSLEERDELLADLEDLFRHNPVNGHIVGGDGLVKYASESELESMGYEPDSYIGVHIARFHADQNVIDGMLEDLVGGTPLINFNATLFHKDGSKIPVMIYSNSRMRGSDFLNTRCFTVPVPKSRRSGEGERAAFSWPRNEDFGFTIAGRDAPAAAPNPMTLALRYIASRKRPEESLGFLACVSQILADGRVLDERLAEIVRLSVPFLADAASLELETGQAAHHAAGGLRDRFEAVRAALASDAPDCELALAAIRKAGQPVVVKDVSQHQRSGDPVSQALAVAGVGSAILMPLEFADHTFGTIAFVREEGPARQPFGPADVALAEEVARRIAIAGALDQAVRTH